MNSSRKGATRTTCIGIPITQSTCTPLLPPTPTTIIIATALSLCRGEVEKATSQPQQQDDTPILPINNLYWAFSSLLLSVSNNNNNNDDMDDDDDDEWGTFVSLDDEEDVYFYRYGR